MAKDTRKGTASVDVVQMASAEIGHKPPQAPEAEEAVIGAMMLYDECLYQAVGSLKEKSFYNPKLRPIFAAISWLFNHRIAVDITTLKRRISSSRTPREKTSWVTRRTTCPILTTSNSNK